MVGETVDEDAAAGEPNDFVVHRQHGHDFGFVGLLDALAELDRDPCSAAPC